MKALLVTVIPFLFLLPTVSAQLTVKDSLKIEAQKKDAEKLALKMAEQKKKLAEMEARIPGMEKDARDKAEKAKESIADNEKAASSLGDDVQDKKKAKQAKKAASRAADDAKDARRAAAALKEMQEDIDDLKEKIADNEKKLAKLQALLPPVPVP
ncbi:hypothetical protein [Foetidibacter luteolus]|uniref:hypothetical protein n=1 Tax=Foetidibacter luteolus TaxID=2608880 RepID=UPI00129B5CA0|nr:hypothetical protein [Foetidibacter luteolus]